MGPHRNATLARGRALAALCVLAALALAGCGRDSERLPAACLARPPALLAALERAPRRVVLADGTSLSRCTRLARTDADLQTLGYSFMRAADTLRRQAHSDPDAALRLGYLAGAVRAGAAGSGLAVQLARRVEQVAVLEHGAGGAAAAALRRGLRAGQNRG